MEKHPEDKRLLSSMLKNIGASKPDERILKLDLRRDDLLIRRDDKISGANNNINNNNNNNGQKEKD